MKFLRHLLVPAVLVAPLLASCSSLSITTEVYDRDLDDIVDVSTTLYRELQRFEGNVELQMRAQAAEAWTRLQQEVPGVFAGTPSDYADAYLGRVWTELDLISFRERRIELQRRARLLGAQAIGERTPVGVHYRSREVVQGKLAELQLLYELLLEDFVGAIEAIRRTNEQALEKELLGMAVTLGENQDISAMRDEVKDLFDFLRSRGQTLAEAKSAADLTQANALLAAEAAKLAKIPQTMSLAPLTEIKESLAEISQEVQEVGGLPLGGPDVARIISADDRYWAKYYNEVSGDTYFGNAEIAIKMLDPGTYSMKGVVFDPSQVTNAIFDGVETAISIAAAAYGVPISIGSSSDRGDDGESAEATVTGASIRAEAAQMQRTLSARLRSKASLFDRLVNDLATVETGPYDNAAIAGRIEELAAAIETAKD